MARQVWQCEICGGRWDKEADAIACEVRHTKGKVTDQWFLPVASETLLKSNKLSRYPSIVSLRFDGDDFSLNCGLYRLYELTRKRFEDQEATK